MYDANKRVRGYVPVHTHIHIHIHTCDLDAVVPREHDPIAQLHGYFGGKCVVCTVHLLDGGTADCVGAHLPGGVKEHDCVYEVCMRV
jgi:hypothetical protein